MDKIDKFYMQVAATSDAGYKNKINKLVDELEKNILQVAGTGVYDYQPDFRNLTVDVIPDVIGEFLKRHSNFKYNSRTNILSWERLESIAAEEEYKDWIAEAEDAAHYDYPDMDKIEED